MPMISYNEAMEKIFGSVTALPPRELPLSEAAGCLLAVDIAAPLDLPPFDNSAMDGVAFFSEAVEAGKTSLKISRTIKAGDDPKPLEAGTCAKIMTGAPIPKGADTVVPVEDIVIEGDTATVKTPVKAGRHIRHKGEDIKKGEIALKKGTIVNSRTAPLLAAMGFEKVPVIPRPRTAVLITGSELQDVGTRLARGKIFDSNSHALHLALGELGIGADIHRIADDEEMAASFVKEAFETADMLITVGGISVGDCDYVRRSLEKTGVGEVFYKAAIKPGKPIYFGMAGGSKPVFGLPGNPVSCLVTFDQFVKPAIYKMMGMDYRPAVKTAFADEDLQGSEGKRDFLRGVFYEDEDGALHVRSAGGQGSSMLKSLAGANCIIVIPEEKSLIKNGECVEVMPW